MMTMKIYWYGLCFLPDLNVAFACGGTGHDEVIIVGGRYLRGLRK